MVVLFSVEIYLQFFYSLYVLECANKICLKKRFCLFTSLQCYRFACFFNTDAEEKLNAGIYTIYRYIRIF